MAEGQKSRLLAEGRPRRAVQWATAAAAVKSYSGPLMTLGNAAAAHVRLTVWCKDVRPPNRAGGGRDGEAVRARDHRHRLVEAARLLEMRQPR
jgi:hypothetical protein